ncbi:transglycosylase SLT domain-containing protein [Thioflexithrix psekupsensis]|uniref:Transglycosylase SLT domain-containing protein n=1 Tax=Thioflexithrix psekupsensis TaxID=1570016 RepID=A0A251X481_9GAMM|nr:transglycosylase SLT domain-containing protein [Thioflexithrix psekupsensis]OUD11744.1 hypothetical protein TPSD3_16990 [Thioflexithrix psekupsensis]
MLFNKLFTRYLPLSAAIFSVSFTSHFAWANNDNWLSERWTFQEAQQALRDNQLEKFNQLENQLKDYPIQHYLRYFYLRDRLETISPEEMQDFLTRYADSPITEILRRSWLQHLAKKADWQNYLKAYIPQNSPALSCHYLHARLETKTDVSGIIEPALALWLIGQSQVSECDPVFNYLNQQKAITTEHRQRRFELALAENEFKLAAWLAKSLGASQQKLLSEWQAMQKSPAEQLAVVNFPDNALYRQLLVDGIKRLARTQAGAAYSHWQMIRKKYAFSPQQVAEINAELAVRAAWQELSEAEQWLNQLSSDEREERVLRTHLQWLLRSQNWSGLLQLFPQLPKSAQEEAVWRYWQARSHEALGQLELAHSIYRDLATERSYYGFLSADKVNLPYAFHEKVLTLTDEQQKTLLKTRGIIEARELLLIGMSADARREWNAAMDQLNDPHLIAAAGLLANQWGWHDRGIVAMAKAAYYDVLMVRFPTPYYDMVLTYASGHDLPYAWVYAIMRQESAFQTDARSAANALGLMQLLPATANEVAKRHAIHLEGESSILNPDINIQLGTGYLRHLLNRFDGSFILSTVAYNAGPSRAIRWREQFGCLATDVFIELIPFQETRHYVQNIMAYQPIFEYRLLSNPSAVPRLNLHQILIRTDCA